MKKLLAILILLLCVSIAMTMHLPAAARGQTVTSEPVWQKIVFTERKDLSTLVSTYPFLKRDIQGVQHMNDVQRSLPPNEQMLGPATRVLIAQVRSQKKNLSLFFLRTTGAMSCGTAGCGLTIYADEGNGYHDAADFIAFEPVYISTEGSKVAFLFCAVALHGGKAPRGPVEWDLKNHVFVRQGPPTGPVPPNCR